MLRIDHNTSWKQDSSLAGLDRRCLPPSPIVPFLEVSSSQRPVLVSPQTCPRAPSAPIRAQCYTLSMEPCRVPPRPMQPPARCPAAHCAPTAAWGRWGGACAVCGQLTGPFSKQMPHGGVSCTRSSVPGLAHAHQSAGGHARAARHERGPVRACEHIVGSWQAAARAPRRAAAPASRSAELWLWLAAQQAAGLRRRGGSSAQDWVLQAFIPHTRGAQRARALGLPGRCRRYMRAHLARLPPGTLDYSVMRARSTPAAPPWRSGRRTWQTRSSSR